MMQRELENKNGVTVIQKLTKELKKLNNKFHNDETIKNKKNLSGVKAQHR